MHEGNDFYGHRRVLSEYVFGEPRDLVIWGYIQHGWNLTRGISQDQRARRVTRRFVWSAENARKAWEAGDANVVPIGAPFLYLAGPRPDVTPQVGSTLVYPFHSWEGDRTFGSHDRLAAELLDEVGAAATVCLYWLEWENQQIRQTYESAGFRVICHGHRNDDPDFLHRQIAELERHETVVANRVSTAIWYAGFLGRTIRIVGQGFGIGSEEEGKAFVQVTRERWPELFASGLRGEGGQEVAARELGGEFVMPPDRLAASLGWTGWRRVAGPPIRAGLRARKRLVGPRDSR